MREVKNLKISHTGQENGPIYLSDIDRGESNTDPSDKLQVYIPENGSITLPLNERVIQSYNQGTIRGFMDQGLVRTSFVNSPNTGDPVYEEVSYTSKNKPSKVEEWESSSKNSKLRETQYTYDSSGNLSETVEIQYANNGTEARRVKTTYTKDDRNRVTVADTFEV